MQSIVAVETILRLALSSSVDTKVLRLVHGMAPRVLELQAKHESDEAYIPYGEVLELTGIGSKATIPLVVHRQVGQVGGLVQTMVGTPGRFVIEDRAKKKGRGESSRWDLRSVDVEPVPLRWAEDGAEITGAARTRVERALQPGTEAMRRGDGLYRLALAATAVRGFGDVPVTVADLREWGWSRSGAYRVLAEAKLAGWYYGGVLWLLTELLEDPDAGRPPLATHCLRVKAWISGLIEAQDSFSAELVRRVMAVTSRISPARVEAALRRLPGPTQVGAVLRT